MLTRIFVYIQICVSNKYVKEQENTLDSSLSPNLKRDYSLETNQRTLVRRGKCAFSYWNDDTDLKQDLIRRFSKHERIGKFADGSYTDLGRTDEQSRLAQCHLTGFQFSARTCQDKMPLRCSGFLHGFLWVRGEIVASIISIDQIFFK